METIIEDIQMYLMYCKTHKRLSQNTMRAYCIDTNQFIAFLKQHQLESLGSVDIGKEIIRDFVNQLVANYAPRTCKRKIACLKAFFSHLEFEDIIQVNPFRKVRIKFNEPKLLPKIIRRQEICEQLKYIYSLSHEAKTCSKRFCTARMIACYELMIGTGIRVGELSRLRMDDLDLENQTIRIWGKGSKERIVYLTSQQIIDALKRHLKVRQECGIISEYLFTGMNGIRMKETAIRRVVRKVGNRILHRRITPHMFRHTFATMLLENNVDICYIQALLGHSSIKTTQIYLHLSNTSIKTALISAKLREQYG